MPTLRTLMLVTSPDNPIDWRPRDTPLGSPAAPLPTQPVPTPAAPVLPVQPVYIVTTPTSATAITAMITGILAVLVVLLPKLSGVLAIIAIACGHQAVSETKPGRKRGRGLAVAGLITGYVAVVIWLADAVVAVIQHHAIPGLQ